MTNFRIRINVHPATDLQQGISYTRIVSADSIFTLVANIDAAIDVMPPPLDPAPDDS